MTKIKKKCSFVLLEVLIGIALVALFALPLVSFPIWQCKSEINNLKTLQLERIADQIFAETLEDLYKNNMTWSDIADRSSNKKISLKPIKFLLDSKTEDLMITKYIWSEKCYKNKEKPISTDLRYINIKIKMEAAFLPFNKKIRKKSDDTDKPPKGVKTFSYKVLAKNCMGKKN